LHIRRFDQYSADIKQELINAYCRGPKFRANPFNSLEEAREVLKLNLKSYLSRLYYSENIETAEYEPEMSEAFAGVIVEKLRKVATPYHPQFLNSSFGHPKLSRGAQYLWRAVGKVMVCTDMEKSQHNYACVCPCRYVALLKSEIAKPQYVTRPVGFDSVLLFTDKESTYPLLANRTAQGAKRVHGRMEINATVMKYEGNVKPQKPLTNASLRIASKMKL